MFFIWTESINSPRQINPKIHKRTNIWCSQKVGKKRKKKLYRRWFHP